MIYYYFYVGEILSLFSISCLISVKITLLFELWLNSVILAFTNSMYKSIH